MSRVCGLCGSYLQDAEVLADLDLKTRGKKNQWRIVAGLVRVCWFSVGS